MEAKTKFGIGEKIYGFNDKHKLVEFEVAKILIAADNDCTVVRYYPSDGKGGCNFFRSYEESCCFASESDAVAYIRD